MKTLLIITGPTAIGKSRLALLCARELRTEIICADSRQIYRGMPIATAAPTPRETALVPHRLTAFLDPDDYYSAALFEQDALRCARAAWERADTVVVCGGSMMYIDALCHGIDPLPTVPPALRRALMRFEETHGTGWTLERLRRLDPVAAATIDCRNPRRVFHALEVTLAAGRPYSELCTGRRAERPFRIVKVVLEAPRPVLFERINSRVTGMLRAGLEAEARSLYGAFRRAREAGADEAAAMRRLNALNTVGLREMFARFEGRMTLSEAADKIRRNTRVYAKKQMTWLARDPDAIRIDATEPPDPAAVLSLL